MKKYLTGAVAAALLMVSPLIAQNPPAAPPAAPQDGRQGPPNSQAPGGPPPEGRQGPPGRGRGPAPPPGPGRSNNPFPAPIPATEGVITVNFVEFATVPDAGADPPRMDLLVDEPGTRRMVVNTMQGMIKEKNTQQGKMPAIRADLRMGAGPNGQLLVLNKRDGIIRLLVP